MIVNQRLYSRNPTLASSEHNGEYLTKRLQSGRYYFIQNCGARIWDLLEQRTSLQELIDCLYYEYDVDLEQCRKDLEAFVTELVKQGLVLAH